MKYSKIAVISSLAFTFAISANVHAFRIDLAPVNGGAGPGFADPSLGDGDRIMSSTQDMNEIQFNINQNTITVVGFDFSTASVGDIFDFSEVGLANLTAPLPPTVLGDSEGYLSLWELNATFNLLGTATVTSLVGNTVDLEFAFDSGTLDIFYDETFNLAIDAGATQVLWGSLTSGGGDVIQSLGSATQNAGSFVADFISVDLLDGFWLQSDGVTPFLDNLTFAFADGNINRTDVISGINDPNLVVLATSDGSISFAAVPEPAILGLMGLGLLAMGGLRRRIS